MLPFDAGNDIVQRQEQQSTSAVVVEVSLPVEETSWPSCWSKEQYIQKCTEYKWLTCCKGKLGCVTCKKVGNLTTEISQGLKLSNE